MQSLLAEAERRLWPKTENYEKFEPKHLIGAVSDPAVGEIHIHLDSTGQMMIFAVLGCFGMEQQIHGHKATYLDGENLFGELMLVSLLIFHL